MNDNQKFSFDVQHKYYWTRKENKGNTQSLISNKLCSQIPENVHKSAVYLKRPRYNTIQPSLKLLNAHFPRFL